MKFLYANRIAPDGAPRSAASHLGLCCLPMSHKKDARLIHLYELIGISVALKILITKTCPCDKKRFLALKNQNFQMKNVDTFLIFAQNIRRF